MNRNSNLTTHSFRKTGYLFAKWGGGEFETIRTSARHKSDKMAQRYMTDAAFLLQNAKAYDENAEFQVPRFKMSIMLNEESGRRINENSLFRNIFSLAAEFMKRCEITDNHHARFDMRYVLSKVMKYSADCSVEDELTSALEGLSIERADKIKALFVQVQQRQRTASNESNDLDNATPVDLAPPPNPEAAVRPRRGGSIDLVHRKLLKSKKGLEKLELLLQIENDLPEQMSELTEGARTWIYSTLRPVTTCLRNHYGNDKVAFVNKWKLTGGITRFKKNCCNGENSEHCSI